MKENIKNYELTFEGQGMPYIYEIALYKYYLPIGSLSIIKKGVVQEFMQKDILIKMNEEGLKLTPKSVTKLIQRMDGSVKKNKTEIESILNKKLTSKSVQQALLNTGEVTQAYYFFDPHFFDAIFTNKESIEAAEVVRKVQEYKNVAREYFNDVHFGDKGSIPRLLQKISEISAISFEDLQNYNEEELIQAIKGLKISSEKLNERKKLYILNKVDDTQFEELTGQEAEEFCNNFYSEKEKPENNILKGKVANATQIIVQGIVKRITRNYNDVKKMYEEMDDMKEGDILVTQTTDPEMMPALRKAKAAITDIGGMLSHTAIVARELGITCIVDTKFATQILKDGDMVEVDANNGIVTIIKKSG